MPVGDGHLEVLADREPDSAWVLTGFQRLVRGAIAQPPDHLVARNRRRINTAEPGLQPVPELCHPHPSTV